MTNKSAANHQVVWPPRNPWYPYELPPRLQERPRNWRTLNNATGCPWPRWCDRSAARTTKQFPNCETATTTTNLLSLYSGMLDVLFL